jgi:hypothetical protein
MKSIEGVGTGGPEEASVVQDAPRKAQATGFIGFQT